MIFTEGRCVYVLCMAAILFLLVIKKEIKGLKLASVILFSGVSSFIVIFSYQLISEGNIYNKDESYEEYYAVRLDLTFVKSFSIILVAFSFQYNLFPMYNNLKH